MERGEAAKHWRARAWGLPSPTRSQRRSLSSRKRIPVPAASATGWVTPVPGISRLGVSIRSYLQGWYACVLRFESLSLYSKSFSAQATHRQARVPVPPILSLKSPASPPHRHTLKFLDAQKHAGCAFFSSHVPCERKGPLTDLLSQDSSGKRERGSRENTQPPVVALSSGKSDEKRMRNETGSSPRPTAHPHEDRLPTHPEPRKRLAPSRPYQLYSRTCPGRTPPVQPAPT